MGELDDSIPLSGRATHNLSGRIAHFSRDFVQLSSVERLEIRPDINQQSHIS